jgi:AcrR family transcriptional regulator
VAIHVKRASNGPTPKEEKVLTAAQACFFRYGFRKTRMEEIAHAAGISRPALYLVYSSKEDVFRALLERVLRSHVTDIKAGVVRHADPLDQLAFAFEVWCVRSFEAVQKAPDAADLLENSREVAAREWSRWEGEFEAVVRALLEPALAGRSPSGLSPAEVAHLLITAIPGFKSSAESAAQLRRDIRGLLTMALASGSTR